MESNRIIHTRSTFKKMDATADDIRGGGMGCESLTTLPFKNATRAASVLIKCAVTDLAEQLNAALARIEEKIELVSREAQHASRGSNRY